MEQSGTFIFLDIDGVLQPLSSQKRFKHDLEELRKKLAEQYGNEEYLEMDMYDLGAVYYDWDREAVERLRKICTEFEAGIIISSAWRLYSPLSRLKDYFRLHNLDIYIKGETSQGGGGYRDEKIADYLKEHKEIRRFVILDDAYTDLFEKRFPDQFVYCRDIFDEDCYRKARKILQNDS
ncbi:MAG: HAD domain-containing protein [Desulfococcaceae bacterium]|jgi:hypothetical protein|nr:HAD domain-containing protein [Desulfococcaceae bacterium]